MCAIIHKKEGDDSNMKKENCFYYFEEHDMGAHIPCCKINQGLGNCPCENCDSYLSRNNAYKLMEEQQEEIKRLKEIVKKYELEKSWDESPDRMNGSGGW